MRLRAARTLLVEPELPAALEPLRALSRNLYWTWHIDAADLFARIDQEAWRATNRNPVRLLQQVATERLAELASDDGFLLHLKRVQEAFETYLARTPRLEVPGTSPREVIAYFSLEYGLTESLPNYSGGLGVLAADHLKAASDLGLPLVAVGLLYHEGYFQQRLAPDGWQSEERESIDVAGQPLTSVRGRDGRQMEVRIPFPGREVAVRIWRLDVGRVPVYLLDTNIDANAPADRDLCNRLYGGDNETRIQQEMLVGIGGVRALHALDLHPAVCHMNEGHSALLGVERIRMMMKESGLSFEEARLPVSAATTFTTHTAVAAGIDLFAPELVTQYLAPYYAELGLDDRAFLSLGRVRSDDDEEPFSMAVLGLHLTGYRNGVSQLHGVVSRRLWEAAWPNLPQEQIPIGAITNGIHLGTWVAHDLAELYDRFLGPDWLDEPERAAVWSGLEAVPDDVIWRAHERLREQLVTRARDQARDSAARLGLSATASARAPLDPEALTIGFARRFASYKRATLLFRDLERLERIVNNPERPVQFIFAGKAHPRDEAGKQLIREVVEHSRRPEFRDRLIVLERYDVELARALVQGCDVWLNTPLRPLEASGTSGMKAAANGALQLSVLDGWWAEAYEPGLGWAIGLGATVDDPEVQDALDAASLYELLEHDVAPMFYEREAGALPARWIESMKRSIATFAPRFNTARMVQDYAEKAYTPAAEAWGRLRRDEKRPARELAAWLKTVREQWDTVKILDMQDSIEGDLPVNAQVSVQVQAHLGSLSPTDLRFDVVHGPSAPDGGLTPAAEAPLWMSNRAEDGICHYEGTFQPQSRGRVGYALRVLPNHPELRNPFDTGLVLWA
ncbi:MAG: alpha-glucan family phosphorylase [Dehalococcoidia bacterium]